MDYNVCYSPRSTAITLGFREEGQLEITVDSLRVTGHQPDRRRGRLAMYPLLACMAVLLVLWLAQDQWSVVLGHTGYWAAFGVTLVVMLLPLFLIREKKGTVVFPVTQLRKVICQDSNITLFLCSDSGAESILVVHSITSPQAREIASALEMRRPFVTPIWFGYDYDVQSGMLVPNDNGILSLNDQQLVFSNLYRWRDPSTRNIWLILVVSMFLTNLYDHMLRAATISAAIVFVITLYVVSFGVVLYIKHRGQMHSFSYEQVMDIVPQGGAMLLNVSDASGRIRAIFFRLTDVSQMPTLLAELQKRISPATE